jgi:hypothetical protein
MDKIHYRLLLLIIITYCRWKLFMLQYSECNQKIRNVMSMNQHNGISRGYTNEHVKNSQHILDKYKAYTGTIIILREKNILQQFSLITKKNGI